MYGMKGILSGKLEQLASLIPGLSGRKGLGLNEVDAGFMRHLSEKVLKGKDRMDEIKREFSEEGKISVMAPMDHSIRRLTAMSSLLKTERYSRNATSDNMEGQDLDKLYDFDMTLLEEVDKLDLLVEEIATSDGFDAKVREEIKKLEHFLNEIEELLAERSGMIKEA